jgi:alpha-glucosidase (family GH31 glycosyl hydrolase)
MPSNSESLYGSSSFHIESLADGLFNALFFFNAAPLAVEIEGGILTHRAMNGPIVLSIFLGATMEDAVLQNTDVVGRPRLQSQWAPWFHHCRWRYSSISTIEEVIANFSKNNLPLDCMWSDIDYMDRCHLFTINPTNYPFNKFKQFITDCKAKNISYVTIVDPGVGVVNTFGEYPLYDEPRASEMLFFNRTGLPYVGRVWPGDRLFANFFPTLNIVIRFLT